MAEDERDVSVTYKRFRMGEAFPADDVVAEWLMTLALVSNDFALVATRMEEDAEEPSGYKFFYWTRLFISHFHEAALYLDDTKEIPEIKAYVASLDSPAPEHYAATLAAYAKRKS